MTSSTASSSRRGRRPQIYFGWWVALGLAGAEFALIGVAVFSFIMFMDPLAQAFGWSGAQTGALVSAMWLVAPLALFCAPVIKRFGPWRLVILGLCIQAVAMVTLSLITEFWQLYLLRILMGVGKVLMVTALPVIVAQWFARRFATAWALVWSGASAGGLVMSPVTQHLNDLLGWRNTTYVCAVGVLVVAAALILLSRKAHFQHRLGLPMDGDTSTRLDAGEADSGGVSVSEVAEPEGKIDLKTAARMIDPVTAAAMILGTFGVGAANIAVLSQQPKLMEGAGLSSTAAAAMLGLTAGAGMIGSATIGVLLDRARTVWSSVVTGLTLSIGLLSFFLLPTHPHPVLGFVASISIGYAIGALEVVWITLTKRQFGITLFAITYGVWYFTLQVGYAIGGGVGGWSLEHLGSSGYLLTVTVIYLPTILFGLWRPSRRMAVAPLAHR